MKERYTNDGVKVCDQPERTKKVGYFAYLNEEQLAKLPEEGTDNGFDVELLDVTTGKTYQAKTWVSYEEDNDLYAPHGQATVNRYFYYWHYCPCHRVDSIIGDDKPDDDGCHSGRYYVQSITHPALPGINLYREEVYSYVAAKPVLWKIHSVLEDEQGNPLLDANGEMQEKITYEWRTPEVL